MGVLLKWEIPDLTEVKYDLTSIERADSETGPFNEIVTQNIKDNSFFDINGLSTHWYRIRFKDTQTDTYSDYSNILKGGSFFGYCTPDDVRDITNIDKISLSDSEIFKLIMKAQKIVNKNIFVEINEEQVKTIDNYRKNTIDGNNKIFYTQNSWKSYIGDKDGDGEVTSSDVEVWQYKNDTKQRLDIDSIDERGKIVLLTAPSADTSKLTISYMKSPVSCSTPDPILNLATSFLTAAFAFTKIRADDFDRISLGSIRVSKIDKSFNYYYKQYEKIIYHLKYSVELL